MRITRDALLKLARETAATRARRNRGVVAIILTGSLLTDQPLLGGVTDIDLVLIHNSEPGARREIQPLSDEVHLDLYHYPQEEFAFPRRLRADRLLGSALCANPLLLHDTRHWFEYVQASACAQFDLPENVLLRARPAAESARRAWLELHAARHGERVEPSALLAYLDMLRSAGDAIALLSAGPLPVRRFFQQLPVRAQALGKPGLASGLADLLTGEDLKFDWEGHRSAWMAALASAAAAEGAPAELHPARHRYYERGAAALQADFPAGALWLLLRSWTKAVLAVPDAPTSPWAEAAAQAGFDGPGFLARLRAADAYLDYLEETLDEYARRNGVEASV